MRKGAIAVAAAVIFSVALAAFWWMEARSGAEAALVMPEGLDLAQGEVLYGEYCASCHGANLEGQPDWQSPGPDGRLPAPPHDETGHTWHHPDSVLFQYTMLGGREALALQGVEFDSGMPGFEGQLSDQEIWTILAYIRSTWPERARAAQAARTEASLANEGG
ncbi:cytochrome C [Meridianimarinicoccus roseus]|uniref:Cytochrome C n=1 Tax=Meridianimarinicoccus roseus TaxID=2072018 RepID=A0A2V2LER3_9RHOB|nr:cytochrome c [Meridianimarinicoccus roseus]PWR02361.1 cytochrome C [Meridianimarinicoccus roseus]